MTHPEILPDISNSEATLWTLASFAPSIPPCPLMLPVVHLDGHPMVLAWSAAKAGPVRTQYILHAERPIRLTNDPPGHNSLDDLSISLRDFSQVKELRFSSFLELVHSFVLEEAEIPTLILKTA